MKLRFVTAAGALLLLAPAAFAQQDAEARFKGQGAAGCIAAGEFLAAQPGADAGIRDVVLAWRQVLHVMDATEDQRRVAVDSTRASFAQMESTRAGMGKIAADAYWSTVCRERQAQVRYITVHASAERARNNLAEEPGSPLADEAVRRLNGSVTCLVAAELFSSPGSSRSLRTALGAATPRIPDAAALQAIQARSRREIDDSPGSAAGKALLVDYLRFLFDGARTRPDPQPFVNRTSQHLQDRCQPAP